MGLSPTMYNQQQRVWLAVCVRIGPIDPDLIEICRDTIGIGRDLIEICRDTIGIGRDLIEICRDTIGIFPIFHPQQTWQPMHGRHFMCNYSHGNCQQCWHTIQQILIEKSFGLNHCRQVFWSSLSDNKATENVDQMKGQTNAFKKDYFSTVNIC